MATRQKSGVRLRRKHGSHHRNAPKLAPILWRSHNWFMLLTAEQQHNRLQCCWAYLWWWWYSGWLVCLFVCLFLCVCLVPLFASLWRLHLYFTVRYFTIRYFTNKLLLDHSYSPQRIKLLRCVAFSKIVSLYNLVFSFDIALLLLLLLLLVFRPVRCYVTCDLCMMIVMSGTVENCLLLTLSTSGKVATSTRKRFSEIINWARRRFFQWLTFNRPSTLFLLLILLVLLSPNS